MKIKRDVFMVLMFAIVVAFPAFVSAQADIDNDGDGYCETGCTDGSAAGDCDDTDVHTYPGAPLLCDARDNNCDGWQDYFTDRDVDGDGVTLCAHWQTGLKDCNDDDPNISPLNVEGPPGDVTCSDGIDNDCDFKYDAAQDMGCWYPCNDNDGDLYGFPGTRYCPKFAEDCDDTNPLVNPDRLEICNGIDDNCDGSLGPDESDNDGDGFIACNGDCDDTDPSVYNGAPEICDGIDNDCDGQVDEDFDVDGDGYTTCDALPDCDDSDPNVYPGASLLCDGKDNNCDSYKDFLTDEDKDGDGVVWCAGDCDDTDPERYPGAPEKCNGIDDDCDHYPMPEEYDFDHDGYYVCDTVNPDCDDHNASIYTGAPETCGDGIDNDCDTLIDCADPNADCAVDSDGDGQAECAGDCNDSHSAIYTGAPELCDGMDNDCDGSLLPTESDTDGDGIRACDIPPDCDDNNAGVGECTVSGLNIICPATLYVGESGICTTTATTNGTLDYAWSTVGNLTPNGSQADLYYVSDGNKNVSVTATLTEYTAAQSTAVTTIDVQPFTVSVSCSNTTPDLGDTVTCDATSSVPSLIDDYVWSSGTGSAISPQTGSSHVTVTAVGTGLETISVDLCTNTGYCQTATQDITINAPAIDATITCPSSVFKLQTVTCTSTAALSSGTFPLSYEWTSSGTVTQNGTIADVSFPSQGNHTVGLKVFLTDYPAIETAVNTTITVTGYSRPSITVDGPLDVLIDSTHTYTAVVDSPSGPVDVTWSVNGTEYTGDSVNLSFPDDAVRNINVQARVQGSGTDPDGLGAKLERVVVHRPKITVYTSGDRKALLGMPTNYSATVALDDSPFHEEFTANLQGEWTLHDSSTSASNPLSVTFDTAGIYTLTYRAWVTGYEAYEKVATVSVRAEEYAFGPFHIHSYSRSEGTAPFYASVAAAGTITGITATEAGVEYFWSFDGGPLMKGSNRSSHVYTTEGTHTINLRVADKYGNEAFDSVTVTIVPPPPLTLGMATYFSNRAHTVPLTLSTYPRLSGGIKGDRLGTYSWTINGAAVIPPPFMLIHRIDTPGTYTVEFTGTMQQSGETVSESFTFDAVEAAVGGGAGLSSRGTMIAITGNPKMLPDDDLNLTATLVQEGNVRADGLSEWTTPSGTVNASSITIPGSQVPAEGITVSVKGYLPEEPAKFYYNRIYVRRVLPAKPMIRILSAPRTAIVGQPLSFRAFAKPSSINAGRDIDTEWLLPDGSLSPGDALSYTTVDSDFVDNKLVVEYRAWLVGYKTESLSTRIVSVTKNPYLWPGAFTMEYFPTELYAPAGITLKVMPVSSEVPQYTLNRNITYTWSIPNGATELLRRSNEVKVRIDSPGSYDFSVDLSDILGNSESVPLSLNVLERVSGMYLTASYDKTLLIEPLRVSLRPKVVNLQGDIVTQITYNEPQTGQTATGSYASMEFLAGTYLIEVTANTRDGKTLTESHSITVGASTPPDCTIQYNISPSVKTVFMDSVCTDPDEKDGVMRYEWSVGPEIISYSYRAYYTYETSGPVTVDLTVTDKAGKINTISQVIDIP